MNICLVSTPFITTPPKGYGGLERIVWDLAIGLLDLGERVVIVGAEGSQTPPGGYTIEAMPCQKSANVDWRDLEQKMWEVYDPMIQDFDIIHGHNWFGFEYASKARNLDLNVCHTHHGWLNNRWWNTTRPEFSLNMMAISDWMAENYTVMGFKAKRVYNGVDMDYYPYSKDHGDRLLYVGRISEFKQPHIAIKAAQAAGYGIDIVGGTFVDNQTYVDEIISMSDGDTVKLWLDAPHEKKIELLQSAKALLFPSAMGEPFGLVIIEALACGTPVIALDDGAVNELLTSDSGIVCKPQDKGEEVQLMTEAINDIDDLRSKSCRDRAEMFSKEIMAKNYLDLYKEIIKGDEW